MSDGEILGIIVKALKAEAYSKPNEKIYIGNHVLTYREFAEALESCGLNDLKQSIDTLLNTALNLFKTSGEYREKIMRLAGVQNDACG
jgi:hypothetical protein